jgi:hypothetical protein
MTNSASNQPKITPSASEGHTTSKPKKAKKFDPIKKAKNALKCARQRCTNPNNPDYEGYGGAGIKFLIKNFEEFATTVGLPKNDDVSLDRKDAHGHYEVSNLRWTNKHVQAANKKKFIGKSGADISEATLWAGRR